MRLPAAAGLVAGVLACLALAAPAAALTHEEYVAQADHICRPGKLAFKRNVRGLKQKFRRHRSHGRSDPWRARQFGRLYGRYGQSMRLTTARLRTLPPPPESADALGAWLDGRDAAADLYVAGARSSSRGKFGRFIFTLIAAGQIEKEADFYVAGYGFRDCAPPSPGPQL